MIGNEEANILVVDDEKYICGIIVEALGAENYNTVSFTDPAKALDYIKTHPIDLVLTDLVMGEHSGIQVLETTLEAHEDAAVILMTAHPTVQTAISVLKKGAYDFLIKPFKLELLRATIRRALNHQRIVRENLHLKGQVEFLKVASAAGAEVDIEHFLGLVVHSCKKEMAAAAAALIEIDDRDGQVIRTVHELDVEDFRDAVLDPTTLDCFRSSRCLKPVIRTNQVVAHGRERTRIHISQPVRNRGRLMGVINLVIDAQFDHLTPGQIDVLMILANSAASTMANLRLYRDLRHSYLQAIGGLAKAIEARDEYTAGHTDRVSKLAEAIAREMGWTERQVENLLMGCTLHDVGKLGIPDSVLNKPGKLTDDERAMMLDHPRLGFNIIQGIDFFKPAIPYILSHHESYDGSGYPEGLRGDEIPIEGRVLAVADTFDAIVTDRPYRKGAGIDAAADELLKYRGVQFDPEIVDVFLDCIEQGKIDLEKVYGRSFDTTLVTKIRAGQKVPV